MTDEGTSKKYAIASYLLFSSLLSGVTYFLFDFAFGGSAKYFGIGFSWIGMFPLLTYQLMSDLPEHSRKTRREMVEIGSNLLLIILAIILMDSVDYSIIERGNTTTYRTVFDGLFIYFVGSSLYHSWKLYRLSRTSNPS